MDEYYAHAIKISNFKVKDFDNLEKILKSGHLLSRMKQRKLGDRSLNTSIITAAFNGINYISLCDLKMSHEGHSAYDMYIKRGLSLLIDRDIPVIKPILIDENDYTYYNMKVFLGKACYSNLVDEVQVKDKISLEHLKGMCLSLSVFKSFYDEDYINDYIKYLNILLNKYNYDVPIYNLDDREKIKIK